MRILAPLAKRPKWRWARGWSIAQATNSGRTTSRFGRRMKSGRMAGQVLGSGRQSRTLCSTRSGSGRGRRPRRPGISGTAPTRWRVRPAGSTLPLGGTSRSWTVRTLSRCALLIRWRALHPIWTSMSTLLTPARSSHPRATSSSAAFSAVGDGCAASCQRPPSAPSAPARVPAAPGEPGPRSRRRTQALERP